MAEKRVTWAKVSLLITKFWEKCKAHFENKIEVINVNGSVQSIGSDKSVNISVPAQPTKLSQLSNDTGFITKEVTDLKRYWDKDEIDRNYYSKKDIHVQYYTKDETADRFYTKDKTYSRGDVDSRISSIPKFAIKAVEKLPTSGISETTIYLVKQSKTQEDNLYTEYIRVADKWEKLGEQKFDLSGYVTGEDLKKAVGNVNGQVLANKGRIDNVISTIQNDYYDKSKTDEKFAKKNGDEREEFVAYSFKANEILASAINLRGDKRIGALDTDGQRLRFSGEQGSEDSTGMPTLPQPKEIAFLSDIPIQDPVVTESEIDEFVNSLN